MKVTVVIPHYNSLDTLWALLAQLREDSFDEIIVIDDASTIKPVKVEAEFPAVKFHYGSENKGPGANRNRALELVKEGVIWFIDADMEIVSQENADRLRTIFTENDQQMIGGMIYTKEGKEMEWNYGHEMNPVHDTRFMELAALTLADDTAAMERLKKYGQDYSWLDHGISTAKKRTCDWVAEGNFALPVELLRKVGGYDESFYYHEGQDLAKRIRGLGATITFIPDLIARHVDVEVRSDDKRAEQFRESQFLFFKKHWGMSRPVFEELYKL